MNLGEADRKWKICFEEIPKSRGNSQASICLVVMTHIFRWYLNLPFILSIRFSGVKGKCVVVVVPGTTQPEKGWGFSALKQTSPCQFQ